MSEIDEYQRRITAAMDRIGQGLEKLNATGAGEPDAEMVQALEDERTANAQLTERVRVLKAKSEEENATLRAQLEESATRMTQLDIDLQKLRAANAQMREACQALQDANAQGVGDADLINAAMTSELAALRAARAAEVSQADTILAALTPLVETATQEEDA